MAQILDKQGLQHYANKMCNADNRKVGSKSLPTALNEIDTAIDGFKTLFESEYGTPVIMELENNENVFSVGTGINIDKKNDVENSFTDLTIGGNSLVNLMPKIASGNYFQLNASVNWITSSYRTTVQRLKPNTKYTVILDVHANNLSSTNNFHVNIEHKNLMAFTENWTVNGIGRYVKLFTTKAKLLNDMLAPRTQIETAEEGKCVKYSVILLEGDWTNKPIPQYFEGMKSVGQDDVNGHKIEILSSVGKENLINNSDMYINITDSIQANLDLSFKNKEDFYKVENKIITMSLDIDVENMKPLSNGNKRVGMEVAIECEDGTKKYCGLWNYEDFTGRKSITYTYPSAIKRIAYAGIYIQTDATKCIVGRPKIEISDVATSWCPSKTDDLSNLQSFMNKKEILLNEPLRSVGDTKDTIEKVNGEWKIVRRCGESILNGSENWSLWSQYGSTIRDDRDVSGFGVKLPLAVSTTSTKVICNNFATGGTVYNPDDDSKTNHTYYTKSRELIYCYYANASTTQMLGISIKNSKLGLDSSNWNTTIALANFKNWLSQNPTKVIYQLDTPIIEDISPVTLQCWKNGTISIDEVLPVESTHTVALNKSAQIQKNIEELTVLRNRVKALEKQYDNSTLNQAYELELLRLDMELDNIV